MAWPRIAAESLRELREAPSAAARPTASFDPEPVIAQLRAARIPGRSALPPPAFLRPQQHDAWRRTMYALEVFHGALLLEAVGTGKTWVALAVAAHERRPAVAIVPAILQSQWRDATERAGVNAHIWTHERASRGKVPDASASLVIIDEAHRFRDHGTRRVRTVAPWLAGCRVLLLTATPIVNRLADLVSLLRLALPEDALALDGIWRLGDLELVDRVPDALRRVAIRSPVVMAGSVPRRVIALAPDALENRRGVAAVASIGRLALSSCTAVHRLLSSVLLDAAASSDAAFHQALKRYRALLLQSRDAGGASRAMLRRFAGDGLEQLVFWPLLTPDTAAGDLPVADIDRLEQMLTVAPNDDPWIGALIARCSDDRPTVCFSRHRATARRLRDALGEATAWVTGHDAGIGPHRVAREAILTAFGPRRHAWRVRRTPPRILVATDVAAEGLDLHAAGRIVHVDLPWTATRVEQREGRLLRLGQQHRRVEVVIRMPAAAIERAFAPHARVRRKHRLAHAWLRALESDDRDAGSVAAQPVVASVADNREPVTLVAVQLQRDRRTGAMLMIRKGDDGWRADDALADDVLARARSARPAAIDAVEIDRQVGAATRAAAAMVSAIGPNPALELVGRIHRLARTAATRRDGSAMRSLDRWLRFAIASPTLGGRMIMARLGESDDETFLRAPIPDVPQPGAVQATVMAAVICSRRGS
ncbi:MAG TPA: DEAD/DEAH box helicase [Gemmatimonadales bacterium]